MMESQEAFEDLLVQLDAAGSQVDDLPVPGRPIQMQGV